MDFKVSCKHLLEGSYFKIKIVNNPERCTTNSTEKIRGIYTVGWNYRRKRPNSVGKRPTVGIIFRPAPIFSQLCQFSSDFDVSYHFGIRRQTNNIGGKLKNNGSGQIST